MKKWNKLISVGVLITTVLYTCSPVVTLAVQGGTAGSVQSTELSSIDDLQSITSSSTESMSGTSSTEDQSTNSAGNESKASLPISEEEVEIVPVANAMIRFSESANGSSYVDNKNVLTNQTYHFHLAEDGWYTIQNSVTKNYLTVETDRKAALYFTTLQNTDEQKWRLVDEENETYHIESKTKQFLEITETNSLQVGNGESNQRWSLLFPTQETQSTENSNTESTTETSTQTSDSIQKPKATNASLNVIETTPIDKTKMKITIKNPNGGNVSAIQFPTWSTTNGQDDIKWLNGTKNSDGSWSVTVDANQFKHDGQFITHVYTKVDGRDVFLGSTSYTLAFSPKNVIEQTAIGKDKMKITIKNPNGGNVSAIQFPTWSTTNGQDDIQWLNGTKNSDGSWSVTIDSSQYKHDGKFTTHVYAKVDGRDKFLGSTSYTLDFPLANSIEQTAIGKNKMKITIKNPNGGNVSAVQFPTWSTTNGQDDIKWLNGTKESNGSWSVTVDANEYKHDGKFTTHVYAKVNGRDKFLGSTSYTLEFPPANSIEQTAIGKDKMKITIKNPNRGNVSAIQFPTWSTTNGQDDIKWLNGTKNSDGSWSVTVDSNQYKHDGKFTTHVYAKVNGRDMFLGSTSYTLEFPPANIVEQTAISKNKMKITIKNPNRGNVSAIQFPTWSTTNGQDDIKWLNGTKNSDGSWSVTVDANQYKHSGQFITHIYTKVNGRDVFLASTSYNLNKITATHLFVMGHGGVDPGAVGNGTNEREFTRNELLPVFKKYAEKLKESAISFYDPSRDMYQDSKMLNGAYTVSSDLSSVTEVHLDSGGMYSTGGHVIITPGAKTAENKNVSSVIKKYVGWSSAYAYNQGLSERTDLLNLNVFKQRNIPYRLTELGFISNATDVNSIRNNKEQICKEIIEQVTGEKIQ